MSGPFDSCDVCGRPIGEHSIFHDEPPSGHGLTEAVFRGVDVSGFYCPPLAPTADYGIPAWAERMTDDELGRFIAARHEEIAQAQAAVEHQHRVMEDRRYEVHIAEVVKATRRMAARVSPNDDSEEVL